ncbi:ABC transporter permease [Saccharothrix violaceirubra]|uniref:ABC-2 type transport system permease protein n=1 Tax=Saccharothrix violaceirubra TaxID=413306 RepID=A0A7W7T4Z2_9PSEU|nr:ABC transporter permease [Saccharothrix violaceirubra]MBB4966688.1 ABC-2 type transport system permease protein [Saccharothrix violaceirubra]
MKTIIKTEWTLFLREPATVVFAVLFPSLLLVVLGAIPALRQPQPDFGNLRFIDSYAGSLVVITMAFLGLNRLPATVAGYRENGVLRRMSTTPVHPGRLLVAQLAVNLIAGAAAFALVLATGRLVFGIELPRHPVSFVLVLLVGLLTLSALGLLIAAWAPNARVAGGLATVLFLVVMFFGGVYLPRFMLPEVLVVIGDHLPPAVGAIQSAWLGTGPSLVQTGITAVIGVLAGTVAARSFRWE